MTDPVKHIPVTVELALCLDFLAGKIELLSDFERCLVRDRLGAVLRYGKRAVVTPKQADALLQLKKKYSRTALDALGEDE